MFWRPNKKEITEWIERKKREFSREQNRNPWLNDEHRLQRYVFIDLYEIFFGEFSIILTEWLERIVKNIGRYRDEAPRKWTPELIRQINTVNSNVSHAIEF
jgi:hypothetical protein